MRETYNGDKSHFMLHPNAFTRTKERLNLLTGLKLKKSLFTYLGCPIYQWQIWEYQLL